MGVQYYPADRWGGVEWVEPLDPRDNQGGGGKFKFEFADRLEGQTIIQIASVVMPLGIELIDQDIFDSRTSVILSIRPTPDARSGLDRHVATTILSSQNVYHTKTGIVLLRYM